MAGGFLIVDTAFFFANLVKVMEGGYVPLALATATYGIMWIWHRGATAVMTRIRDSLIPLDQFVAQVESDKIPRVPGTAVFLTRTVDGTPPVLSWHVKHNRALHSRIFILRVSILTVPWLRHSNRLEVTQLAPDIWRGEARYGFMESPDVPALLALGKAKGCSIDLDDATYYVGHETVVRVRTARACRAGKRLCSGRWSATQPMSRAF